MAGSSNLIDVENSIIYETSQHSLQQNSYSNNLSTEHNPTMFQMNSYSDHSGIHTFL